MIARRFIDVATSGGTVQLHYRVINDTAREVPTLFLLHPSPLSSAVFEVLMSLLPPWQRAIAVDTPGYGLSAKLPTKPEVIADYLPTLREFFRAAAPRDNTYRLYGSATGAQLALGYAVTYPQEIDHLLLDNAAHFSDARRGAMLQHYFIDTTPRDDGSHLHLLWQHCQQMLTYFPWYATDAAHRIRPTDPSPLEVQSLVAHFIAAGPDYAAAYRAAFLHERAEHYQSLTVPTTLFRWLGSPLLPAIDELLAFPLPDCITVVETPVPPMERFQAVAAALKRA